MKVGVLLRRTSERAVVIWIPTQDQRIAFPFWTVFADKIPEKLVAAVWELACTKMRNMIGHDFQELREPQGLALERSLKKFVVAHSVQDETCYIYFLGVGEFTEQMQWSNEQKKHWIPRVRVINTVRDGKLLRGSVAMSTRVIFKALQDVNFDDLDFVVSIPGLVKVQSMEDSLTWQEKEGGVRRLLGTHHRLVR